MPAYEPSDRCLSDEEWAKIISVAKPAIKPLLEFIWATGCRPGEARKLEAHHWDEANSCFVLSAEESKGKKRRRVIYVTPELRATLDLNGRVFKTATGLAWSQPNFATAMAETAREAGVEFTARSMRHSYISRAIRKGVPATVLRRLVGHTTTKMIDEIYSHVDDGELLTAAEKINGHG
jgi:integrase